MVFPPGVPAAPAYLSPDAAAEYRRVVTICKRSGRELQQVDMAILELYATAIVDFRRLTKEIAEEGEITKAPSGYPVLNPKTGLRSVAFKQAMTSASKLGFSPTDRLRVSASKTTGHNPFEDDNEFSRV